MIKSYMNPIFFQKASNRLINDLNIKTGHHDLLSKVTLNYFLKTPELFI